MHLIFQFFINLPSEGKTTKEANMSGSIQAVSNCLQNFKTGFQEKTTRFANWTSSKLESVQKTARAFFGCLANVILWPIRSLASAGKATHAFFFGTMAAAKVKKPETAQAEEVAVKREADVSHA